jgi:hypothetical protein
MKCTSGRIWLNFTLISYLWELGNKKAKIVLWHSTEIDLVHARYYLIVDMLFNEIEDSMIVK